MTRRLTLIALLAFVALPGTGCYHLRNWATQFRANHPCLFPCANPYYSGAGYGNGFGACCPTGCATSYSQPTVVGQPMPGAVFGPVTPLPNTGTTDPKTGIPNPMNK